ncbi:FimD/PapC N-terminal domain-containing protein [Escherichia coli]|uniref:FimD/PapC N-terminal domain-containing protein n=1 Tax=Escherichia coli TaxID=562 RepID=UPI0034660AF0
MKQRNSIFEQLKCTKNCRAKLFVLLFLCDSVNAEKYIFERDFLADSEKIDLTLLESSAYPSGRYYVSLYLNGEYITKEYMYFDAGESEDFCIQYSVLQDIGVTVSGNQDECANLDDELNLRTRFDFYSKRMDIFVSPKFVPRKKTVLRQLNFGMRVKMRYSQVTTLVRIITILKVTQEIVIHNTLTFNHA